MIHCRKNYRGDVGNRRKPAEGSYVTADSKNIRLHHRRSIKGRRRSGGGEGMKELIFVFEMKSGMCSPEHVKEVRNQIAAQIKDGLVVTDMTTFKGCFSIAQGHEVRVKILPKDGLGKTDSIYD